METTNNITSWYCLQWWFALGDAYSATVFANINYSIVSSWSSVNKYIDFQHLRKEKSLDCNSNVCNEKGSIPSPNLLCKLYCKENFCVNFFLIWGKFVNCLTKQIATVDIDLILPDIWCNDHLLLTKLVGIAVIGVLMLQKKLNQFLFNQTKRDVVFLLFWKLFLGLIPVISMDLLLLCLLRSQYLIDAFQ